MNAQAKTIGEEYATNDLEREALEWMNEHGEAYDDGAAGSLRDLFHGGCQSGIVGHLIYTRSCVAFYERHRTNIAAMLKDAMDDIGAEGPGALFGYKWDTEDPLALGDANQNLLAWFGFEEAVRTVANRAGIKV